MTSDNFRAIGGEGPRGFVGGLWHELGELQFKFLVEHGLRPEHILLDIGCGSLRAGVRLVPYLAAGNYLGLDIDAALIEHGKEVELGRTLMNLKCPEFVVSGFFEFHRFLKRKPDFVIAQSLFTHLTKDDISLCLKNLRFFVKDETVFFATFFEVPDPVGNPDRSHPHKGFRYSRDELMQLGTASGWEMRFVGDWCHPRDQKMVRYVPA